MLVLFVLLLMMLLTTSAFLSSSEVALFSLSHPQVKSYAASPERKQQLVAKLLRSPKDLLVTLLTCNIFVNILLQNVISSLLGAEGGWWGSVGIPLALVLICGEIIPKSVGLAHNISWAERAAPLVHSLETYTFPLRKVLIGSGDTISRFLFFFLKPEAEISSQQLQHALKQSRDYGVLSADEAELMRGYLHLQEAQVREFMRPREEVLFYSLDEPLSRLIHLFVDRQCSRIPLCRGGLDDVVGVMTSQLYFLHRDTLSSSEEVLARAQKPFYAPEGMAADALLMQLYEKGESLALVVDEYGSISGLISVEDLVEAVVGEIADARDEKSRFSRAGDDVIIASGKMEIGEFFDVFDYELQSEHNRVTVGGWLIEQIGDIPKTGAKYTLHGFLFHVLNADMKKISRIYIRKLKAVK